MKIAVLFLLCASLGAQTPKPAIADKCIHSAAIGDGWVPCEDQQAKPITKPVPPPVKMVCWDGFETVNVDSKEKCTGDWIVDHTGEHHPSGDGCNTSTCIDAACRYSVGTLVACSYHPDGGGISFNDNITSGAGTPVGPSEADILVKAVMRVKTARTCAAKGWPATTVCEGAALAIAKAVTDLAK